jgi:transketolase
MTDAELDQLAINTIRTLSIDAVQTANTGHPGTPMALHRSSVRSGAG